MWAGGVQRPTGDRAVTLLPADPSPCSPSIDPAAPLFPADRPGLDALLAQLVRAYQPCEAVPLSAWSERVLARYAPPGPRSTRARMGQAVREAAGLLTPAATTADLTADLALAYSRWLAKRRVRPATANGLLRALRTACNLAVEWRWLASSPFSRFAGWHDELAVRPSGRARSFSRAQIGRLLGLLRARSARSWTDHRLYAFALLLAYTGLRRNEALSLRRDEIDWRRRIVWIEPRPDRKLKTRASAAGVPLPEAAVPDLRRWSRACRSVWLYPGVTRSGPWLGGAAGKRAGDQLAEAGRELGLRGLTPHSLRHSLATHLAGHWGLSPRQVQLVLRHADVPTQRRYVHPELADLVELVRPVRFDGG